MIKRVVNIAGAQWKWTEEGILHSDTTEIKKYEAQLVHCRSIGAY